jgi:glycosyltransferase involved in cell wall biosynthesis
MAAGMERVLYDEASALHLRGAGERRARLFSWSRCAQETMNAYHTVLQRG